MAFGTARQALVKKFYRKHGVDGLLMLYAFPPKKSDLLRLPWYEKRMIEKWFLKPQGGFTEKGLRFFKRKVNMKKLNELTERGIETED